MQNAHRSTLSTGRSATTCFCLAPDAPALDARGARAPRASAVTIDGHLSRAELYEIVDGARVRLAASARKRMAACHDALAAWLEQDRHVYGATSGVGDLRDVNVRGASREELQLNIVRSHCCAVGDALPPELVRAALALRTATFACGYSAVRPRLAEHMIAMLNARVHPIVPELGSVGASGDPVLLAHMALGAVGEGYAQIGSGSAAPADQALANGGLQPIALASREGLALVNGLDFTIGAGALLARRTRRLLEWADAVATLTLDALDALDDPFLAEVQAVRGSGRHAVVAERVRRLRAGARTGEARAAAPQDPYCLRCIPQVHGASWTSLDRFTTTVDAELTAVIDNPLVFAGDGTGAWTAIGVETGAEVGAGAAAGTTIRHCGHFHGQELALAADHLALGVVNLANIAQARLSLLLRGTRGLPRMLSPAPGCSCGLMMLETTGASLLARMRARATPMSIQSIAASSEQEDHTSMSWDATRRTDALLTTLAYVIAAEATAAAAAAGWRAPSTLGRGTRALLATVTGRIGAFAEDRPLGEDLEALASMMLHESWSLDDGD